MTFLDIYDLDINFELKYYPSRETLSSLEERSEKTFEDS